MGGNNNGHAMNSYMNVLGSAATHENKEEGKSK